MATKSIRLVYRKLVDASSTGAWEKLVFDDSYQEFLMQAQLYNPEKKWHTFAQLMQHSQGAAQLHFLVSTAVVGYVKQLGDVVPDITNAIGQTFLPFTNFRFEIVNSDIRDKARHQVAINFYSEPLVWHDTIGAQVLVSVKDVGQSAETLTHLVTLQPFLSIYSLQETTA